MKKKNGLKLMQDHAKKCIESLRDLAQSIMANKLGSLHTVLLCWLVYRVEDLHSQLQNALGILMQMGMLLMINIQGAAQQFNDAIDSILAIFKANGV